MGRDLRFPAKNTKVEVSSAEEGFKGSFYTATIVDRPQKTPSPSNKSQSNKFLVEYDNLLSEDGSNPLRELVNFSCIRPLPSGNKRSSFEINDAVDANHSDGWWTGVIENILGTGESRKYRVMFKDPPHHADFARSELRPHLDWVGGKWVSSPKKETNSAPEIENVASGSLPNLDTSADVRGRITRSSRKSPLEKTRFCTVKTSPKDFSGTLPTLDTSADVRGRGTRSSRKSPSESLPTLDTSADVRERCTRSSRKSPLEKTGFSAEKTSPNVVSGSKRQHEKLAPTSCSKKQKVVSSEAPVSALAAKPQLVLRRSMRLKEAQVDPPIAKSKLGRNQPGGSSLPKQNRGSRLLNQIVVGQQSKEIEMGNLEKNPNTQNSEVPLNVWCRNSEGPSWETPSGSEVGVSSVLPFVKSSPVWELLESSEVFQKAPQNPHFKPLGKESVVFREGLAVGRMMNFSNTVDLISKLRYDDPNDKFDVILKALPELEKYGFDIKQPMDRLSKLMSIKADIAQLEVAVNETETRIKHTEVESMEKACEITRINDEIDAIVKKLKVAKEKKAKIHSTNVVRDIEVVELKSTLRTMSGHLEAARQKFQKLAAGGSLENE